MKYLDQDPIIEKVKNSIKKDTSINLVIFTDSNLDNLSYCKSLKRINDKEQYVNDVEIVNINEENDLQKFISAYKVFIMNSIVNDNKMKDFVAKNSNICYSEIMNCNRITPTPDAIFDTIKYYYNTDDLSGLVFTVSNRSDLIGKPLVNKLIDSNATINWIHTKTNDDTKEKYFVDADCIITAAGKPNTFWLNNNFKDQLIVDAGINVVDGKVCGDWCIDKLDSFEKVTITKNPGGIGKLTTHELFKSINFFNNV